MFTSKIRASETYSPRRIVVTGALGHVGSRLIHELPIEFPNADIVMLDNLSTQRYVSLFNLPSQGRYRFVEGDILTADLAEIFCESDAVIHLAAITDAAGSNDIPERLQEINVRGTERVAYACIRTGSALLFPSSTSVYGVSASIVDENCQNQDLLPQSLYAHSKLKCEQMLAALGKSHNLDFIICRLGTVFGVSPGMRFHTAINKFIWQASQDTPLTVWRTALQQRRPYLDLSDAAAAVSFILRQRIFDRQIYNVLTTNATVSEIVEYIRVHVPDLQVNYVDSPIMNQLSYTVSNRKFRALGFEFKGNLRAGIEETVQLLQSISNCKSHSHALVESDAGTA